MECRLLLWWGRYWNEMKTMNVNRIIFISLTIEMFKFVISWWDSNFNTFRDFNMKWRFTRVLKFEKFLKLSIIVSLRLISDISKNQMHQVTLDPQEKVKLTWLVDWSERNVFFHVKNGLIKHYRWFAIGFSRRGEFPRTDFCFFQRNNEKTNIHAIVSWTSQISSYFLPSISNIDNFIDEWWKFQFSAKYFRIFSSFFRPSLFNPNEILKKIWIFWSFWNF